METTGSGTGFRGALGRLRSAPLWVWLTVLLTFGLLVFAYLQWRKSSSSGNTSNNGNSAGQGTVPSDGSGQPMWNTASQGAFVAGNVTDLAALLAYLQSQQTPNPSPTATPTTPPTGLPLYNGTGLPPRSVNRAINGPVLAPGPSGGLNGGAQYFTITQNYSAGNAQTTTLSGIAQKFGTSVNRLMQLNPQITNPNLVYKGEKIRVA